MVELVEAETEAVVGGVVVGVVSVMMERRGLFSVVAAPALPLTRPMTTGGWDDDDDNGDDDDDST